MTVNNDRQPSRSNDEQPSLSLFRLAGWVGVIVATPFFLWVPLGFTGLIPSMIDVFGIVGLRIPAAFTIAGLLLFTVTVFLSILF
ncbi:MAG: hypothetical protein HN589_08105 [Proteobacteria bacterium]|nr:hypothetical protein [Pseudomonadota bacterium]